MKSKAFSLMEVVVTITIIGVITGIAVATFKNSNISSDVSAKASLASLLSIENNYFISNESLISGAEIESHDTNLKYGSYSDSGEVVAYTTANNNLVATSRGNVGCWYLQKQYGSNGSTALWGYKESDSNCLPSEISSLASPDGIKGYDVNKPIILK